jgi:hypothetical protein
MTTTPGTPQAHPLLPRSDSNPLNFTSPGLHNLLPQQQQCSSERDNNNSQQTTIDHPLNHSTPTHSSTQSLSTPTNSMTPFQDRNNRYIQDLLSAPRIDGMSFCLIMIDKCYYELQRRCVNDSFFSFFLSTDFLFMFLNRCDDEYTLKIQQRHKLTLEYIQDIHVYKKELFSFLIENKDYKVSFLVFGIY